MRLKLSILNVLLYVGVSASTLMAYNIDETVEVTNCAALADYGVSSFEIDMACTEGTYTFNGIEFRNDRGQTITYMGSCEYDRMARVMDPNIDSLEACVAITAGGFSLSSSNPTNGAKHIALDGNITLEFSEAIARGTGNITLHKYSDDSLVESFPITDENKVTITDATATLQKTVTLEKNNYYYINIPATAISTAADNSVLFEGISDNSSLKFSTNYQTSFASLQDIQLDKNSVAQKIDLNPIINLDGDDLDISVSSTDATLATLTLNTFAQIGEDINGEADGDQSGYSVSLSSDGSIIAIGAPSNTNNKGHVRVYKNINGTWVQLGEDIDGEADGDQSGFSVSLSDDGSIVAIGAHVNDGVANAAGHVRVYKYENDVWTQIGDDIDGETENELAGWSVSLSGDGSILAISAPYNDETISNAGQVRVYENISGTWTQIGNDIAGESSGDYSGMSISLNNNGTIVAIGAEKNNSNTGQVRVYENVNGTWTQIGADIEGKVAQENSGSSVSLNNDGNILAIAAPNNSNNKGAVRIYKYENANWTQIGSDIIGEEATLNGGSSVSLSADGLTIVIGAQNNTVAGSNAGHVRVYKYISGVWEQIGFDIDSKTAGDISGNKVSLSADGSIVAIGAPGNDSGRARVYSLENELTITPKLDAQGTATVTVNVNDAYETISKSFTLQVGTPTITSSNVNITIDEDRSKTFSENDFSYTGELTLSHIIITTLESAGALKLDGVDVILNQEIAVADLSNLVFTPAENANGTVYATFGFKIKDSNMTSTDAYTATINVTAVDDVPTIDMTTLHNNISNIESYSIELNSNDIDGDAIGYTASSLDTTKANVSIENGNLVITPINGAEGSVTVVLNAVSNGKVTSQEITIDLTTPTLTSYDNLKASKWNMISLPKGKILDTTKLVGITDGKAVKIYRGGAWIENPTEVTAKEAIWVNPTSTTLDLSLATDDTTNDFASKVAQLEYYKTLSRNEWHFVGVQYTMDWSDLTKSVITPDTCEGYTFIKYYDSANDSWNTTSNIPAGAGIWLRHLCN